MVWIVDLAAARTGEVALEERLEHQHERVALDAAELLLQDVEPHPDLLTQRDAHRRNSRRSGDPVIRPRALLAVRADGSRKVRLSAAPGASTTWTTSNAANRSSTPSTSTSGVDAPAVTPTCIPLRSQRRFISLAAWTR